MAKKTVVKDVQVIKKGGDVVIPVETQKRVQGILGQVAQDIGNAELGRFHELRAGVGLIVVRELCEHGEWGPEMVKMIPNRSPRTLRLYMEKARRFLEEKALMASDIYDKLMEVTSNRMIGEEVGRRLMIGDGKAERANTATKLPKEVEILAEYIREMNAEKQRNAAAASGATEQGGRKISKAEQLKAARDFWNPVASKVQKAGITDRLWELLPDDELESVQTAIASVAVAMRQELKARGK